MKLLIRIAVLALGLGLPLAILSMHGGRADAQTIIHGDTLNSQVELFCNFFATGTDTCLLTRLSSDGTTLTQFAIPSGKTFVSAPTWNALFKRAHQVKQPHVDYLIQELPVRNQGYAKRTK